MSSMLLANSLLAGLKKKKEPEARKKPAPERVKRAQMTPFNNYYSGRVVTDAEYDPENVPVWFVEWRYIIQRIYSNKADKTKTHDSGWNHLSAFKEWWDRTAIPGRQLVWVGTISRETNHYGAPNAIWATPEAMELLHGLPRNLSCSRTGYVGVSSSTGKSYQARVYVNGKQCWLGSYSTGIDAHLVWQADRLKRLRKAIEVETDSQTKAFYVRRLAELEVLHKRRVAFEYV